MLSKKAYIEELLELRETFSRYGDTERVREIEAQLRQIGQEAQAPVFQAEKRPGKGHALTR